VLLGAVLLAWVPFRGSIYWNRLGAARMLFFLIPQALSFSVPVGLTLGILAGLGRAAQSDRLRTLVLIIAAMWSIALFGMLAWVVPASNQAFRVAAARQYVAKGANELTLAELGQLLAAKRREPMPAPNEIRSLALNYHMRWALAGSPFVLACFAVVLTRRRRHGRLMLGLVGCVALVGHYVITYTTWKFGIDGTMPSSAAAWTSNAVFLILSVAMMTAEARRPGPAPRT
jgi:lipopolysaccharide export LptBFGC system permease protein LptF